MSSNIENILSKAQWAPSGDNEQAWRIKIVSENCCDVTTGYFLDSIFHFHRHSDHIALGCFIENIHIAASESGLNTAITKIQNGASGIAPVYRITLTSDLLLSSDPLAKYIEQRSVNRFMYAQKQLTFAQKQSIEKNLPSSFKMIWLENKQKQKFAQIVFKAAAMRYLIPEMFDTHSKIIDWERTQSPDRIPSKALGMPTIFLPVMQWMLGAENRMAMYNRFLAGHYMTAFKLEYLPNIFSSAGIAIIADDEPKTSEAWIAAGRAIQRFWLTITSLGLSHQPAYTPLIFSKYAEENKTFSSMEEIEEKSHVLKDELSALLGGDTVRKKTVWLGRVGYGGPKQARSIRRPLSEITQ